MFKYGKDIIHFMLKVDRLRSYKSINDQFIITELTNYSFANINFSSAYKNHTSWFVVILNILEYKLITLTKSNLNEYSLKNMSEFNDCKYT